MCKANAYMPVLFAVIDTIDAARIETCVASAVEVFLAAYGPPAPGAAGSGVR